MLGRDLRGETSTFAFLMECVDIGTLWPCQSGQVARSNRAIEETLMKALLPKESGGRTGPLGLAEAGSRHRLGLKEQEEEAGSPEPRENHPSARQTARHVVCADEPPRTWRRVHSGAGGIGMAEGEKTKQWPDTSGACLPLGCSSPDRFV